jgi:hypothetical protein
MNTELVVGVVFFRIAFERGTRGKFEGVDAVEFGFVVIVLEQAGVF